jgi:hypothetical protein
LQFSVILFCNFHIANFCNIISGILCHQWSFIMPWKCFLNCVRPETEDVRQLDYQHSMLQDVPPQVFAYERTLEELYLDSNRVGNCVCYYSVLWLLICLYSIHR